MRKTLLLALSLLLTLAMAQMAAADVLTFDDPVVLGSSGDPGAWYVDRYAPAGFANEVFDGGNRLQINISGADQQNSSFYNYQGRKYDFGDSVMDYSIVGDLYVDGDWDTPVNIGLWATLFDSTNATSGYPIVAWRASDTLAAGFYAYNYKVGGWISLGTGYATDAWYSIAMTYTGTSMDYYINGVLKYSLADAGQDGTIGNIILNSYNSGNDYTARWDNVGTKANTPEPASMLLLGSGMAGFAAWRRRRRS